MVGPSTETGFAMKGAAERYVCSVRLERYFRRWRHHWLVCRANEPDELVAWGHAPTQELAEAAARNQIADLASGLSKGGRVVGAVIPRLRH